MTTCAVVQLSDNVVINMIVANPESLAPEGTQLILISENVMCNMGWIWNGTEFVNPNPITE